MDLLTPQAIDQHLGTTARPWKLQVVEETDSTDAFDTLYIGCEKFPQHDLYPIAIGGVR